MGSSLGQLINNHSLILISVFPGHSPAWPDPALVLDMFKNEALYWRKQGQSSRGSWEGRSESCLSEAGVRWIFREWFSALAFSSCSFISLSSVLKSDPHNLFSRVFPLWSQFSANYRFFNPVRNATVTKVFWKIEFSLTYLLQISLALSPGVFHFAWLRLSQQPEEYRVADSQHKSQVLFLAREEAAW